MERLMEHDWGEEWRALAAERRPAPDEADWDKRSQNYPRSSTRSPYVDAFIEGLGLNVGETAFDMGCGNGVLSIPLAMDGHQIIAADFSQGMLNALKEEAAQLGGLPIKPIHMSWADDWAIHGITDDCVDVAIASRSICTDDLEDSIRRLDAVARRRCAVTLPVGLSPRSDPRILAEIGLPVVKGAAAAYAFLILMQMGRNPEVRYIESVKPNIFENEEDAVASIERMVHDALIDSGMQDVQETYMARAEEWTLANIVPNPDAGLPDDRGCAQGSVMLDIPRRVTWAYVSWNVA